MKQARWLRTRLRTDRGAVAGWEALPFGLLIFVIGTLVIANAWGVVDAKMAANAAAREGARAFIHSPAGDTAASDGVGAAAAAIESRGRDPEEATVTVTGSLERCAEVTVTVVIPVPSIAVPWVQGLGPGLTARSVSTAVVDPLRSGLEGEADCVGV